MKTIIEYRYNSKKKAISMQRKIKRDYGYTPSIMKLINPRTGKSFYAVVKPRGLVKINRGRKRERRRKR